MRFTKMEGCGNDYIYINGFEEEVKYPDMLAVAMSERHFGVGADGLVFDSAFGKWQTSVCGCSIWTVPKGKCAATLSAASANMFMNGE